MSEFITAIFTSSATSDQGKWQVFILFNLWVHILEDARCMIKIKKRHPFRDWNNPPSCIRSRKNGLNESYWPWQKNEDLCIHCTATLVQSTVNWTWLYHQTSHKKANPATNKWRYHATADVTNAACVIRFFGFYDCCFVLKRAPRGRQNTCPPAQGQCPSCSATARTGTP